MSTRVTGADLMGHCIFRLLGHEVQQQAIKAHVPSVLSAPGLPPLNPPQILACQSVLTSPLALIQGPPGTGKTVTSASLVFHMARHGSGSQVSHQLQPSIVGLCTLRWPQQTPDSVTGRLTSAFCGAPEVLSVRAVKQGSEAS